MYVVLKEMGKIQMGLPSSGSSWYSGKDRHEGNAWSTEQNVIPAEVPGLWSLEEKGVDV